VDYFAVTDHSHYITLEEMRRQREVAERFNVNGQFATLHGFEMTWNFMSGFWGHMNVLNTDWLTPYHEDIDLYKFYDMLVADKWDIVTIQQASGKSAFYDTYQPYADNLIAKIRELAPQAEIVIQQTWSYAPYDGRLEKWKMTPKEMYEALKKAYAQLAAKHGLRIIPTADAVQLFRDRLPVDYGRLLTRNEISKIEKPAVIDFHGDVVGASSWKQGRKNRQKDWREIKLRNDFSHFNARGNYLQACVWLGFLFNVDPVTFTYCPKGLPEADARLMRECARDALKASR
jgi:hypothetical protein